jgi:hypothetical protein
MTQRDRLRRAACAMLGCTLALTCMGSAMAEFFAKAQVLDPKNGAARVQEIRTALGLK